MFNGDATVCCEFMRIQRLEYSSYEKLVKKQIIEDQDLPRISMMLSQRFRPSIKPRSNLNWLDHGTYLQGSGKSNEYKQYLVNTIWHLAMRDDTKPPSDVDDRETGREYNLSEEHRRSNGTIEVLARLVHSVMLYPNERAVAPISLHSLRQIKSADVIELEMIPDVVEFTKEHTHILVDIDAVMNSGVILSNRTDKMVILDRNEVIALGRFRNEKEKHMIVSDAAVVSAASKMNVITERKLNCVRQLEKEIVRELSDLKDW